MTLGLDGFKFFELGLKMSLFCFYYTQTVPLRIKIVVDYSNKNSYTNILTHNVGVHCLKGHV